MNDLDTTDRPSLMSTQLRYLVPCPHGCQDSVIVTVEVDAFDKKILDVSIDGHFHDND